MDSEREVSSEWDELSTVDTFDEESMSQRDACPPTEPVGNTFVSISTSAVSTPISLLVQSLIQQLCIMLENDQKRASHLYLTICEKLHQMKLLDDSYTMGEFEVMRHQYQRALSQLVSVANGSELPHSFKSSLQNWPISPSSGLEWSRYHREFEEITFIASGGFGKVYQARNRLDDVNYAIKKICIRSSDISTVLNHFSEVKTFASLTHQNIVAYKAAWLEPLLKHPPNDYGSDGASTNTSEEIPNDTTSKNYPHSFDENSEYLSKKSKNSDSQIRFEGSAPESKLEVANDIKVLCKLDNKYQMEGSHIDLKWATLYIQMALCQKTLKMWLTDRCSSFMNQETPSPIINSFNGDPIDFTPLITTSNREDVLTKVSPVSVLEGPYIHVVVEMFTQLTKGLNYIHQNGIVHHDVKPSNIFIGIDSNAICVQLGDFGLACPLQRSHDGIALGTPLYAAPEQLKGQCNIKSDLYSIGLILLEMLETFKTDMEKIAILEQLRKGTIPAHVSANYPKLAHIIGKLVEMKVSKRICTGQLLKLLSGLRENKDKTIKDLQNEIISKDETNKALREEIVSKDDEIARLNKLLQSQGETIKLLGAHEWNQTLK